ncbi:MAG: alanine--glyoxylate aminotransferase family protein [Gemmatimonadaceae bacterium]
MTEFSSDVAPMLLMTPGPTRLPERVLRAGARPMLHHRTKEFSAELSQMMELMKPLFGSSNPVLPVHTTGRGATEASICNLFSADDEILFCCNGKFGEMWAGFAQSYGVVVHRIATDWGRSVSADEVDAFLASHPNVCAVAMTHCDTSTGVSNDVAAVAKVARAREVLLMVDCVSSLGGMPFAFDEWGVDVAITASQKCLMSSPGLAFVVLSDRAWRAYENARLVRNYWDFAAIRNEVTKARPETPGTPPVHIVLQVAEALRMMHEEGLQAVFARHEANAKMTLDGAMALGLSPLFPKLSAFAPVISALKFPAGVSPQGVRDAMKARGVLTAAAMGTYAQRGFRIGHLGDIRSSDIQQTLSALRDALQMTAA